MGPQDPRDVTQAIARDLVEIVSRINMARADANHWLKDPNYEALRLRLENTHAVAEAALVEARRRVRLDDGRDRLHAELEAERSKGFWARLFGG